MHGNSVIDVTCDSGMIGQAMKEIIGKNEEIINPYYGGRKKIIEMALDDICMKKDMTYILRSVTFPFDDKPVPLFNRISAGLRNEYKRIRLNTNYLIRMVKLTG